MFATRAAIAFLMMMMMMMAAPIGATDTACLEDEEETLSFFEGEAVRFPYVLNEQGNGSEYVWKRVGVGQIPSVGRIHHQGGQIYFIPVQHEDAGVYRLSDGKCCVLQLHISVYTPGSFPANILYNPVQTSELNPTVTCPQKLSQMCQELSGDFSWWKDHRIMPGLRDNTIRIYNASKRDEGVYTCMCSWKHNVTVYNSSLSRRFEAEVPQEFHPPVMKFPLKASVAYAELGEPKTLVCTVFFGFNVQGLCHMWWTVDNVTLMAHIGNMDGRMVSSRFSEQIIRDVINGSSIYTAILNISRVSKEDFNSEFRCRAINIKKEEWGVIKLKHRDNINLSLTTSMSVAALVLLALLTIRFFMVDLTLLFRSVFVRNTHRKDGKLYDAYVVYPTHTDHVTVEKKLHLFVAQTLPLELEQKHGYRLCIRGRDDLPGADFMEQMQAQVRLSRCLLVILPPGCGRGPEAPPPQDYAGQVALHQALVQEDLRVILVELEKSYDYTHLPQSLQLLARRSAPLTWQPGRRRFWKLLRYCMPVPASLSTCRDGDISLL